MQHSTPYLSFRGISKTFPGVKALSDITFDCYAGQVHALMGENGAGKSTLLKILSGNYAPTGGTLAIKGEEVVFSDTTAALNAGVAIIYQELHLVPEMTVAENIYLGQLPQKGGIVNRSLLNYEAATSHAITVRVTDQGGFTVDKVVVDPDAVVDPNAVY